MYPRQQLANIQAAIQRGKSILLLGKLFEQLIGLELFRYKHLHNDMMTIYFWRDNSGIEVDYVIERNNQLVPLEVKLTRKPTLKDAKHINTFLAEYPQASHGYIICDCPMISSLSDNITALPWRQLHDIFLSPHA